MQRQEKHAKLVQYAERVWNLHDGDEAARIDQAILCTRQFFESLGVPTRLSAYKIGPDAIPALLKQLERHGMVKLGEHASLTLEGSRKVLEAAL